jgi:hypothetical protein
MTTFYKMTGRAEPTSNLPSILWDPAAQKAVFEFRRTNVAGVLAFETDDPAIITMLQKTGYVQEPGPGRPNIPYMATMDPTARLVPKDQLTPQTQRAFEQRRRK